MKKNNKGFTLAELLIVIAIIVILMGVAFVAVQNYQRSSTRLEFDGIAKEIFIAAQNHLTTAESQGYVQLTGESDDQTSKDLAPKLGIKGDSTFDTKDERYFVYNAVNTYSTNPQKAESVLDLMLPFGAIDETVRAGGSYIIRYQPSSGRVLDVFYSLSGRSSLLTVSGVELGKNDYGPLMTEFRGDAKARERYTSGDKTCVVGWYGGEEVLPTGTRLEAPEIIVHNEEVLWVEVIDNNGGSGSLKLIITGVTSGAQVSFERDDSDESDERVKKSDNDFYVILDDITTSGLHFANLKTSNVDKDGNPKSFIPGEDIIIEAVAYNNAALTNVAYSGQKRTNSLFAEIKKETEDETTEYVALIENFRHFENLDQKISGFIYNGAIEKESVQGQEQGPESEYEIISKARQIKNLIWTEKSTDTTTDTTTEKPDSFIEAVKYINPEASSVSIYNKDNEEVANNNCLYPVSPDYKLEYDGKSNDLNHKVSNVVVSGNVDAGLFGSISVSDSEVKNLELIDFTITGTASAGALAGSATDVIITNVLVHNSIDKGTQEETLTENIKSSGTAGGLIGSMSGGSVTECAAAVYVSGSTNAGGLIGEVTSGSVTACYSGGHTKNGAYPSDKYDVVGATAGGLIGVSSVPISDSYSTCSVSGTTAGGFVGSSSGNITNSYATGLVKGTTLGAFAGRIEDGVSLTDNTYYEIINEIKKDSEGEGTGTEGSSGEGYLPPIGSGSGTIEAFDKNAKTYNDFVGKSSTKAKPYDSKLTEYYGETYFLKGITVSTGEDDKFVATHYGDWPAPEIFVINQ